MYRDPSSRTPPLPAGVLFGLILSSLPVALGGCATSQNSAPPTENAQQAAATLPAEQQQNQQTTPAKRGYSGSNASPVDQSMQ